MEKKEKEEGIVFEKESMFGKKKEGTRRREKFKEGRGEQGVGWKPAWWNKPRRSDVYFRRV